MLDHCQAPARRSVRAGAFVLLLMSAACERAGRDAAEGPRVLELAHDTIRLQPGVSLIDISVRREAAGDFDPPVAQAKQGDVVRFTAADNGGHALAFDGASLTPEARDYLERTSQMRGPPLIAEGSAWVITLEGAPPGEYPLRCATHNTAARVTVSAR